MVTAMKTQIGFMLYSAQTGLDSPPPALTTTRPRHNPVEGPRGIIVEIGTATVRYTIPTSGPYTHGHAPGTAHGRTTRRGAAPGPSDLLLTDSPPSIRRPSSAWHRSRAARQKGIPRRPAVTQTDTGPIGGQVGAVAQGGGPHTAMGVQAPYHRPARGREKGGGNRSKASALPRHRDVLDPVGGRQRGPTGGRRRSVAP